MSDTTPSETPAPETAPTITAPAETPSNGAASFTPEQQEQVNQIAARTRAETERKAQAALLEQLGFSSADEAKAMRERVEAEELASMTETERNRVEAEKDRSDAARIKLEAQMERRDVKATRALSTAGCEPSIVDRIAPTLGLPVDADDEQIAEAVASLKATSPALFNSQIAPTAPSAVPGSGRHTPPAGGAPTEDRLAAGAALSVARRPTPTQ